MTEERRITDSQCWDAALIMGLGYTLLYAAMVFLIVLVDIPDSNAKTVDILAGAMTIIQATIVQFFFGSTKAGEVRQTLVAQSKERTDAVLREAVAAAPVKPVIDAKDVQVKASGDVTIEKEKP